MERWTSYLLEDDTLYMTGFVSGSPPMVTNLLFGFMTMALAGEVARYHESLLLFAMLWPAMLLPIIGLLNLVGKREFHRKAIVANRKGISFPDLRRRLGVKLLPWSQLQQVDVDDSALVVKVTPGTSKKNANITTVRVAMADSKLAREVAASLNGLSKDANKAQ